VEVGRTKSALRESLEKAGEQIKETEDRLFSTTQRLLKENEQLRGDKLSLQRRIAIIESVFGGVRSGDIVDIAEIKTKETLSLRRIDALTVENDEMREQIRKLEDMQNLLTQTQTRQATVVRTLDATSTVQKRATSGELSVAMAPSLELLPRGPARTPSQSSQVSVISEDAASTASSSAMVHEVPTDVPVAVSETGFAYSRMLGSFVRAKTGDRTQKSAPERVAHLGSWNDVPGGVPKYARGVLLAPPPLARVAVELDLGEKENAAPQKAGGKRGCAPMGTRPPAAATSRHRKSALGAQTGSTFYGTEGTEDSGWLSSREVVSRPASAGQSRPSSARPNRPSTGSRLSRPSSARPSRPTGNRPERPGSAPKGGRVPPVVPVRNRPSSARARLPVPVQ